MWDTVRLVTNIELSRAKLGRDWRESITRKVDADGQLVELSTLILNRREPPSQLIYSPLSGALKVETSLPKMLYGENVSLLAPDDVPRALDELSNRISDLVGTPIPHCGTWEMRGRLDAVFAWQVGKKVDDYLHALAQMSLPRHRAEFIDHAKTVYFKSARRWLRSYDKYAESKLPQAKGVLRFEVEMRQGKTEMRRYANTQDFRAREILTWKNARAILAHWLGQLGAGLMIRDDARLFGLLLEQFGNTRAIRLLGYANATRLFGRDGLLARRFNRGYLWRYAREIRAAGAALAVSQSGLLPALLLPSESDYNGEHGRIRM
ncbi:MAG: hypothetical protein HY257_04670 [Chloroflexi bacterium]|nr:hypothetical protein [Chloroflexota bacterium]